MELTNPAGLPGDLIIREFRPDDRELVNAFFDQMGGESRAFFNRSDGNRSGALRQFDEPNPNRVDFMAEYDGKMVGYVFLWDLDSSIPWLGIAVAEDFKGRRLGRLLLSRAREYAVERGKGGILLTTHIANTRAQALYERMGYARMGMHSGGEVLYLLRF